MGIRRIFSRIFIFLLMCHDSFCFADPASTLIPTVIVKKPSNYSMTSAPKTIISHDQINSIGATSLSQVLQELGGVQLEDMTGNGSQVLLSMRGFGVNANSNTLLLINGIPITNPDLAPPDLNAIPIADIKYIEIINGSESVLYGDQAVGGIINIITQQDTVKKFEVSCSDGTYNSHNCSAALSHHVRQWIYNINLLNNHTDNYREHNRYDQTLLSGGVAYPYQKGNWSFDYKIINERMEYPDALTLQQVRQNRVQAATTNDADFFKNWNGLFHLKQLQHLNDQWTLQTDISRREMHGSGVLTTPFTQARYIHYLQPQLKGEFNHITSTSGLQLSNDRYYLNSLFGTTNNYLQKYGIFTVFDITATPKLSFSIGARAAQQDSYPLAANNTYNNAFASTIGATYQLTPITKLFLRRAESFRFPNADENAFTPTGITQLKTQTGVSYETGAQWNFINSVSKLSIYQLNLTDEIAFDPTQTPQQPFGANRNLDPTIRRGASLSEKYLLNEKITLDGQYNYVNARFQSGINAGNRIPLVSENIFRAGVNYRFFNYWNAYTEAVYTGNQYSANDDANISGINGGYTYYNFNLRFVYHQFSASFRVNNIFNKYYYLYTIYTPFTNMQSFYPAPGRNCMLTLKYQFF